MKPSVFDGIAPEAIEHMLNCFSAQRRKYAAGERLASFEEMATQVCIVGRGRVQHSAVDADGNVVILELLETNDVFGKNLTPPPNAQEQVLMALEPSEIISFDYDHLIHRCLRGCSCHDRLIDNIFRLSARRSEHMARYINILSQRTLRRKLLTYLEYERIEQGSARLYLPMNLSALATYLAVDRSAMMREISKMRRDGLIESSGRAFILR